MSVIAIRVWDRARRLLGERRLSDGTHTVGRRVDNAIVIDDDTVADLHVEIVVDGDRCSVSDLGSAAGYLHNDQKVARVAELHPDDWLTLGLVTVEIVRATECPRCGADPAAASSRGKSLVSYECRNDYSLFCNLCSLDQDQPVCPDCHSSSTIELDRASHLR